MNNTHSFHIPVMGIGYTLDTPFKVAHLGISSVISLVDDILIENLRKVYSEKLGLDYMEISEKVDDYRAKRITAYLNLMNEVVEEKMRTLKDSVNERSDRVKEYINYLPDYSALKQEFMNGFPSLPNLGDTFNKLKNRLKAGSIDVNIMTKVDKTNYRKGKELPVEFNDAHAALRGFAASEVEGSVILSAGMNPRLYSYMENFNDFYPDESGKLRKKITLKVSDFKSALIQGKYLAKKGLWVSEYRVESGLNCGGHAFASDGFLMGPILEEFKERREELLFSVNDIYRKALEAKNIRTNKAVLSLRISAQGGVGTSEEHSFLLENYHLDSVGWGSPFLLVPEATTVDNATLESLARAREKDLYLSDISPLGVPFNNLRDNSKDKERDLLKASGRPGSSCPKKYVMLNKDLSKRGLCTASRTYQSLKIKALKKMNLPENQYNKEYDKIVEKSCICVGLGTSAMISHGIDTQKVGKGISVCPGPNMAYFSKTTVLKEMIDHIYGRTNLTKGTNRPNMFVKELGLYIDFLKNKVENQKDKTLNNKDIAHLERFAGNINDGIEYYKNMFGNLKNYFTGKREKIMEELDEKLNELLSIQKKIRKLNPLAVQVDYR